VTPSNLHRFLRVLENDGIVHGVCADYMYAFVETWCGKQYGKTETSWSNNVVNCLACLNNGEASRG
jgi:hypothetical protein